MRREVEVVTGAGHGDIEETALVLVAALIPGGGELLARDQPASRAARKTTRKTPARETGDKDYRPFKALRLMDRRDGHAVQVEVGLSCEVLVLRLGVEADVVDEALNE